MQAVLKQKIKHHFIEKVPNFDAFRRIYTTGARAFSTATI